MQHPLAGVAVPKRLRTGAARVIAPAAVDLLATLAEAAAQPASTTTPAATATDAQTRADAAPAEQTRRVSDDTLKKAKLVEGVSYRHLKELHNRDWFRYKLKSVDMALEQFTKTQDDTARKNKADGNIDNMFSAEHIQARQTFQHTNGVPFEKTRAILKDAHVVTTGLVDV